MAAIALTRPVSPSLSNCELTYLERQPIDIACAEREHRGYEQCLIELGLDVHQLQPEPDLPDAVFVEDTAVVLDEVAVIARPGAASRRAEVDSVSAALAQHRPLEVIRAPGTLDGGDVVVIDRTILVGLSPRTNMDGAAQLIERVSPYGYQVRTVPVDGCVHLKSACSYLGNQMLLVNPNWIDMSLLESFDTIAVHTSEIWAADTLLAGESVVMAGGFPETQAKLEDAGWRVCSVNISQFQKAEGSVSCLSLIFERRPGDTP